MKNIGIVTTWFERGAAYVSKQFKEAWEKENEIFIYVRGGERIALNDPNWECENITYGKRYNYTRLDIIDLKHFQSWIEDNNLDVVFFNEQHIWDPIILCKKIGILTGSYVDYYTEETVPLFGVFDFLVCNTKRHLSVFNWHPQVYFIPWGTNQNVFNIRQKKISKKDEIIFFHSAGMNPYRKGTDFLLKAFKKLKSSKAKLIIHTQVNIFKFFPELQNTCKYLIENKKLEIILDTVSAPGLYHRGDVYVYPTRLEGIGLSIVEANCCGLPVITTNEAPMNEFIINGENGFLIDVISTKKRNDNYYWKESYVSIDHLSNLLNNYLINIEDLENRKRKAIAFSKDNFNWEKNSKELLFIIKDLKKIKDNEIVLKSVKKYERSRSLKFYIGNLILYSKLKLKFKMILKKRF